jgi:putative flippase GtrA
MEPTDLHGPDPGLLDTEPAGHDLQAIDLEAAHMELAPALPMELPTSHNSPGFLRRLYARLPRGQMIRYLFVGGFNTVFGFTLFSIFNHVLNGRGIPASYEYAVAAANMISITVAFFGYKLIVFRTKGNYWKEWLKANAVYWSGFLPTLFLLPLLVAMFKYLLPAHFDLVGRPFTAKQFAPYPANAFLTCFGVVYNFIGHKKVTFRNAEAK